MYHQTKSTIKTRASLQLANKKTWAFKDDPGTSQTKRLGHLKTTPGHPWISLVPLKAFPFNEIAEPFPARSFVLSSVGTNFFKSSYSTIEPHFMTCTITSYLYWPILKAASRVESEVSAAPSVKLKPQ